jgi:hypothetical protein
MAWKRHSWNELKPAADAISAYMAASDQHCAACSQGELVQARNSALAAMKAQMAAFYEKLAQHGSAMNKPVQAYHRCSVGDKLAWDEHTWWELKEASAALVSAVAVSQAASDRVHAARLAQSMVALEAAQSACGMAERKVPRRREALEDLHP